MSAIPMNYHTAYTWTGDGEDGDIGIEGHDALPVGSPHSTERFSPEHLLVAAAETCLANYVLVIAGMSQLEIKAYRSSAAGELMQEGKLGYRFQRILLRPHLTVAAGHEAQGLRILEKSHKLCLIARSLSCAVEMEPVVEGV